MLGEILAAFGHLVGWTNFMLVEFDQGQNFTKHFRMLPSLAHQVQQMFAPRMPVGKALAFCAGKRNQNSILFHKKASY